MSAFSTLIGAPGYRLVRLAGPQSGETWPLPPAGVVRLGRGDRQGGGPEVELGPDALVSRTHARLTGEGQRWLIEDSGSKHGTRVNGWEIRGMGAVPLEPWAEIALGKTRLLLAPPDWHRWRRGPWLVEAEVAPAVSFALAQGDRPVIARLVVRNASAAPTPAARLSAQLAPFARAAELDVPALAPGASATLPRPTFTFDVEALLGLTERLRRPLTLAFDGQPLPGESVAPWVLPYNEWSAAPGHRRSLAAFVLPNHPQVVDLALAAAARVGVPAEAEALLAALYHWLADDWHLEYLYEPPGGAANSQKLRLPHQVLWDPVERRGGGTCIDLALLLAAGLEHLGQAPLLALIDLGDWWHALVGCWRQPRAGDEPLLAAPPGPEAAVWVDPTGCTQKPPERLPFAAAMAKAQDYLADRPVLVLDLAGARAAGVAPLPFAGEPTPSAEVRAVLTAAEAPAAGGEPPGTVGLLLALLTAGAGLTRRVVAASGQDVDAVVRQLAALRQVDPARSSASYRHALALARGRAKEQRSLWLREEHLLVALLEIQSVHLDRALRQVGLSRLALLAGLRTVHGLGRSSAEISVLTLDQLTDMSSPE